MKRIRFIVVLVAAGLLGLIACSTGGAVPEEAPQIEEQVEVKDVPGPTTDADQREADEADLVVRQEALCLENTDGYFGFAEVSLGDEVRDSWFHCKDGVVNDSDLCSHDEAIVFPEGPRAFCLMSNVGAFERGLEDLYERQVEFCSKNSDDYFGFAEVSLGEEIRDSWFACRDGLVQDTHLCWPDQAILFPEGPDAVCRLKADVEAYEKELADFEILSQKRDEICASHPDGEYGIEAFVVGTETKDVWFRCISGKPQAGSMCRDDEFISNSEGPDAQCRLKEGPAQVAPPGSY